ncbi:MAG: hypothetical protein Q9226_000749, partial [Calogaya cf. arnoldii]
WVDGVHERQEAFMAHGGGEERWGEDDDDEFESQDEEAEKGQGREGRWESGRGRCAVTGRRVLGGTDGLRRIMI